MVLSKIKREVGKVKMIAETEAQRTANIKWILDNRIELIENYLKENHPYIYRTSTTKEIREWVEKQK